MGKRLSLGFLLGSVVTLLGCGGADTVCGAKILFEHQLTSMGESGSDFIIALAPVTQTISDSTCPGVRDGQASSTASVERVGDTLTITVGLDDLSFSLSGNDMDTPDQRFADESCQNELTNIQGSLDYEAMTLVWSYDLTVTDLGGCFL